MTRTFTIEKGQKPTQEQLKEVMEAKKYKALKSCVIQRNRKKNA